MENGVPPYPIQSVDYALQLLLMLKRDGVLRVSDAAAELGVARSTAHRLISMLRFRGFVEQAPDRTYRAGSAFADLGGGPSSATALLGIARPHLVRLTENVGETSNLMIRLGSDVQFIDSIESKKALRVAAGSVSGSPPEAPRAAGSCWPTFRSRRSRCCTLSSPTTRPG